jgi:anion-transporting  ArsA/GET3 family ATPase
VSKIIGTEVVDDLVLFFQAFEGMEDGFRQRAHRVLELLADDRTAFVLVTAPARDAVAEAGYFADRLEAAGLRVSGLVVNRIHPEFDNLDADRLRPVEVEEAADRAEARRLAELYANLGDFIELARRERRHLEGLERSVGGVPVVRVPLLEVEVCDIDSLSDVGEHLLAPVSAGSHR